MSSWGIVIIGVLWYMIVSVVSYPQSLIDDNSLFNIDSSDHLFTSQAIESNSNNIFDDSLTSYEDHTANLQTDANVFVTGDVSDVDLGLELENENSINAMSEPLDLLADRPGSGCGSVSRKRNDLNDALAGKFRHTRFSFLVLHPSSRASRG